MGNDKPLSILTLNAGSSSLKVAFFQMDESEHCVLACEIDRIGLKASRFRVKDANGTTLTDQHKDLADHSAALQLFFDWFESQPSKRTLDAVGHRVVYGGAKYTQPTPVNAELKAALEELVPLDPEHLPAAIETMNTVSKLYPDAGQVACFDTAFHRTMPWAAQTYAIPSIYTKQGVIRYGFHGLSYEYIVYELGKLGGAEGKVVACHLGSGASMAAIDGGKSMDTTMGFTPTAGLVMGTRSGDLDPGIVTYLLQEKNLSAETVNHTLNDQSGLLAISGTTSDMKDLLDQQKSDPNAAHAVELFCYVARKFVGALAAVLGGIDTLVFAGGIGENAPEIRGRICAGLEFLGIELDPKANSARAPIISSGDSRATVRVIETDEELMIVRHTKDLIAGGQK